MISFYLVRKLSLFYYLTLISRQKQCWKIVWILEARIADKMDANFRRNKRASDWKTFSAYARSKRNDPRNARESFTVYWPACHRKCHLKSKLVLFYSVAIDNISSSTANWKTTFIGIEQRLTKSLLRYSSLKTSKWKWRKKDWRLLTLTTPRKKYLSARRLETFTFFCRCITS